MKKRKIVKKIGCCLLVGSMVVHGVDTGTFHVMAENIQDIETPNYWTGSIQKYTSGGVEWEFLKLHYNGPTYGSAKYEEYITNMKVVSIDANVTSVVIPDQINNCKVKGLGENALKDLTTVKSVTIPKTIERICNQAFQGCSSLTDIQFEDMTTLTAVGEYVFKDCIVFNNSDIVEQLLITGNIQKGMFENCTSLEKITIMGEDVKIADFAFSGCSNLKDVTISDNMQNLEIGEGSFQNTQLKEIEFPCKTKLGECAFKENYYLNKVVFQKDADIGKYCFMKSFRDDNLDVEKSIAFKSGTINIGEEAFSHCAGLEQIIFNDELVSTNIEYKAFWGTDIQSLDFKGENVCIQDSGLVGIENLSELSFHNSSTMLNEEPFYGRYLPASLNTNSKLKKIIFDCNAVLYKGDEAKNGPYRKNYGTFYGLTGLKEVVCEQKCNTFECDLRYVDGEKEKENCNGLDTFYFKNMSVNLDNFIDERKGIATQLYGYQDSVGSYVNHIKVNPDLYGARNQEICYKTISTGLSVIYNGDDIVEGNEINTDNLEVYDTYRDGTISERIPYNDMITENSSGYEYTHGAYQLDGREFLNITYTIMYGDSNCSLPVRVIKKAVNHFDITYVGTEKIEGQTVSADDFVISNIVYNDQSVEENADGDFSVKLVGTDQLEEGSNTIQITYKEKTIPYTLTAKKKGIQKLDIVLADSSKKLFEGGILSKQDFNVTAVYDNGDIEENYTDYILQDTIVRKDMTDVMFVCGDYMQNYQYYGIPLKVDHLNVSYNDKGVEENGTIDKNDLKVTAVYNNGKEVVLAPEEYSFKTYTIIGGRTNTVFVIYNDDAEVPEVPFNVTGIKIEENEIGVIETPTAISNENSNIEPNQSAIPEFSQSPEQNQSQISETTKSPDVSDTVVLEENPSQNPVWSTIPESGQGTETTQSMVPEEGSVSKTEQTMNTEIVPDANVLTLKESKYTVGVQEKVTIKLSQGTAKSFQSKNEKIATVNTNGVVTAKKSGKVKIIVKDKDNNKVTCTIIVKKAPKVVCASFSKKTVKVKKTINIQPVFKKGYYSNKIVYTSSNNKIATVSSKGIVTAKKKGTAVITLKTYNNKKAKVIITVKK